MMRPLAENDARLRQVCATLSRQELRLKQTQAKIDELIDYVYGTANKAVPGVERNRDQPSTVGLSANQVGYMKQISVVDLAIGRRGYHDMHVLVNPRIVWRSRAAIEHVEGCVNFPTIWGKTRRSKTVRVEALDRSGNELALKLTGWPAILLQHEVDHLNGRLFIDRLLDPAHADLVERSEYKNYRRGKNGWDQHIDVTDRNIRD